MRDRPAVLFGLLGSLLAASVGLAAAGWVRVGGPGGTDLGWRDFASVLAVFLVGAVAAHLLPSQRVRLLLAVSLILLVALHGWARAAGALAVWTVFYHAVHLRAGRAARIVLIAAMMAALWAGPWIAWAAGAPEPIPGILTTALLGSGFVLRSVLYAYEATVKTEQMRGAGYAEYLLYLIAAPLCIVHWQPVGFAVLHRGIARRSEPRLLRRGIAQMTLGLAYLAALHAGRRCGIVLSHVEAIGGAAEFDALTVLTASHSVLLGFFLELAGQVHFMIGMMRVLGFDIPAGFDRPYRSRSILEFWRRWNTYFRDYVMTLAYYPVANALRRRPLPAVLAGCALTFIFSGTAHALIDLAGNPAGADLRRFAGRHVLFLVYGCLVAAWMIRETAVRRRRPIPRATGLHGARGGRLVEWGKTAFTLTLFAVLYLVFRRPLSGTTREMLGALRRPPW